jgi:parallel beta-helix repeat protein
MRKKIQLLVICFFTLLSSFVVIDITIDLTLEAKADVLYVGSTGEGNFSTIQSAIDNAESGDTVYVFSGTYNENLIVNKTINLVGVDRNTTNVVGDDSDHVINVTADGVNITGFKIMETGRSYNLGGIMLSNVRNCIINNIGIFLDRNSGIYLDNSYENTISYNIISNVSIGISLHSGGENSITCNTVSDAWRGVSLSSSPRNIVTNNHISKSDVGISIRESDENTIINNHISNNSIGIFLVCSSNNNITRNTMIENGFFTQGESPEEWFSNKIDTTNTVNGNPIYYFINQTGFTVPSGAGHIVLVNCTNVVIEDQELKYGSIEGFSSSNLNITGNNISNNIYGIYLHHSSSNLIEDNLILNPYYSIFIKWSHDDKIINNTLNDGDIHIYYSNGSIISGNNISNGIWGITINSFQNGYISDNVVYNITYGVELYYSSYNSIINNIVSSRSQYYEGLMLKGSSYNNLNGNILENGGFFMDGTLLEHWDTNNIDSSNTVNGKEVYFKKNQTGCIIPQGVGQIILVNCSYTDTQK